MKQFTFLTIAFMIVATVSAQVTFQKTYGDSLNEEAFDLKRTFDGGYILTGTSNSSHPSNLNPDLYLLKTDSLGNMQWRQTFGSIGADRGISVIQTSDSGYSVLGITVQPFRVNSDLYYIKTDQNGNLVFSGFIGSNFEYEFASQILQTFDGGLIMAGQTEAGLGGNTDFYVVKFDQNLINQFSNAYGDSSSEWVAGIVQTYDSNYVFAGASAGWTGNIRAEIVKLDLSCNIIWGKSYRTPNDTLLPVGIKQTSDSGFVIASRIYSIGAGGLDFCLIKINSAGNIIWSKTYGTPNDDYPSSLAVLNNGNIVAIGFTSGILPGGGYVMETDPNGNLLWSKIIFNIGNLYSVIGDSASSIQIAASTNVYGAGQFDMLLIKAASTGNFGCNDSLITSVANDVTITVSTVSLITSSGGEIGVAIADTASIGTSSIICLGTGLQELNTGSSEWQVFPNPSAGSFIVSFEKPITKGNVEILNFLGETILKASVFSETKKEINLKNISAGIYFIKVFDGEKSYCKKIIVEHN